MPETTEPYDPLHLLDRDALDQIVSALHSLSASRGLHDRDPLEQQLQALIGRAEAAVSRGSAPPVAGRRVVVEVATDVEVAAEVVATNLDRLEILADDDGIRHADRLAHFHVNRVVVVD